MSGEQLVTRCATCRRLIVEHDWSLGTDSRHLHRAWLAENGDWPNGGQLAFCHGTLEVLHDRPDVLAAWLLGNDRAVDLINVAERAQELAAC